MESIAFIPNPNRFVAEETQLQPDEPLGNGMFCEGNGGMEIQLLHNAELMELDGLDGNVEHGGHLFGPSPVRNQLEYFTLTGGERGCSRSAGILIRTIRASR